MQFCIGFLRQTGDGQKGRNSNKAYQQDNPKTGINPAQ
jgi:hypothetical protein